LADLAGMTYAAPPNLLCHPDRHIRSQNHTFIPR
jgi:hypothetical protein